MSGGMTSNLVLTMLIFNLLASYYQPPIARGIVDLPLKGHQYLRVGYGDSGTVPHTFFLREDQNVDVGILKLFLSTKPMDLSDIAQSSPFDSIGARYITAPRVKMKGPTKLRFLWDTILIPVVQRRRCAQTIRGFSQKFVCTSSVPLYLRPDLVF